MNARLLLRPAVYVFIIGTLAAFYYPVPRVAAQNRPVAAAPIASGPPQAAIPTKNMLSAFREGGPMMVPIAGCSFALMVFIFERFIALRRGRVIPRPFVRRFLEQLSEGQLDREKALKLCQENNSPIAQVFG